jgi:ParB family chromosome partitioning protein
MAYEKGILYQVQLNQLLPDPEQPRKYLDPQSLTDLTASIASHGVLQPILVREGEGGSLIVVSGERRYQAAKSAGLATIPAMVTDGEPAEVAIIENLLRENLTAIEEAEAIERLRAVHDYDQLQVAAILGKSAPAISEILSLNRLPQEVKDDCRNDPKAGRTILAIIARENTAEKMVALYTKYKESGLTRGDIIKKPAVPKQPVANIEADAIAAFCERIDRLNPAILTAEQKAALITEISKLRSVAYQKLKLLKV